MGELGAGRRECSTLLQMMKNMRLINSYIDIIENLRIMILRITNMYFIFEVSSLNGRKL